MYFWLKRTNKYNIICEDVKVAVNTDQRDELSLETSGLHMLAKQIITDKIIGPPNHMLLQDFYNLMSCLPASCPFRTVMNTVGKCDLFGNIFQIPLIRSTQQCPHIHSQAKHSESTPHHHHIQIKPSTLPHPIINCVCIYPAFNIYYCLIVCTLIGKRGPLCCSVYGSEKYK